MIKLIFRRNIFYTLFTMFLVFVWSVSALAVDEKLLTTLVSEETVTRGAVLQEHLVKTGTGSTKVYVTKINLKDPYIKIDVLYGIDQKLGKNQTVDKMAAEKGAIAAINGDFFDMASGSLFGPMMQEGEWITTPTMTTEGLTGFAITNDGKPAILPFTFQSSIRAANGQEYPVASINKTYTLGNKINIFNNKWDANFLPGDSLDSYIYVVVEENEVEEILINSKPKRIPRDGYVILGHGLGAYFLQENVEEGEEIEFDFKMNQGDDWQFVIGAHTPLVTNGVRANFTRNIPGYHARTAIGYSKDEKYVYWVAVENSKTSTGMTLEELADFMISIGIYQGVNLDGGGSTTFVARHPGDFDVSLINQPEKQTLRSVPNGIGLYTTAPEGKIKDFIIGAPSFLLVNESTFLNLKAIDEFDNPIETGARNIFWKANDDHALVENNMLTALKPGNTVIEVTGDKVTKQLNLEIIDWDKILHLDLGANLLLLNPGDIFSLKPSITTVTGVTREVSPTLFNWEWIGVTGGVTENGELQAGSSLGSGWLVGSYDRFSAMVPVQIGTVGQVIMNFENRPDLKFQGVPKEVIGDFSLNKSEKKEGSMSGALTYDFSQANADTQAAYGVFDSKEVSFSGMAKGMSLWVYGDEGNYWLRAEVLDQNGQTHYITLADKVNWSGWKELSVDFPEAIDHPLLKRIYLVKLKSSVGKKPSGMIFLDQISYKTGEPIVPDDNNVQIKLFANEKRMLVNGEEQIIDQGPIVEKGRSYIPARFLIEAIGGKVFWQASDKQVRILLVKDMIDLWVNDNEHIIVNGRNKPSDTAPIIRNNRTLIPVRMVTENLGYKVDWHQGEITIKK
ncbi:MAG: phosphodiester glycosidase family protein [Bacillota bacterium]|jgi:exopolysaccharide biosynthesis protein